MFLKSAQSLVNVPKCNLHSNFSQNVGLKKWSSCHKANHIAINNYQRFLLGIGSGVATLLAPWRGDMLFTLSEVSTGPSLQCIRKRMLLTEEGRGILENKLRFNSRTVDIDRLRYLSRGTLGREYIDFMDKNSLSPDSRSTVQFVDDEELAYVLQRYREIHDFNHLLLGMNVNMIGEVTVKWFEAIQTGLPMAVSGALLGPLRLTNRGRRNLRNRNLPWVVPLAVNSAFTMAINWENRLEQSLADLRRELSITPLPERRRQ